MSGVRKAIFWAAIIGFFYFCWYVSHDTLLAKERQNSAMKDQKIASLEATVSKMALERKPTTQPTTAPATAPAKEPR